MNADTEDPSVHASMDVLRSSMLEQRVVLVSGEVDAGNATQIAASLMTLDATGDERIELRLSSCTGPLATSMVLVDVLDVLGVRVIATALGSIEGGPVAVLAACSDRRVAPHSSLRLREPDAVVHGSAADLERMLAEGESVRSRFHQMLASRCGRPIVDVAAEWERRSTLEAADAITLGYADRLLGRTGHRKARDDVGWLSRNVGVPSSARWIIRRAQAVSERLST